MNRINLLTMQAFASVLILFLSACAEDPLGGNDQTGKGHTVTVRLSATVVPVPETKASIKPANSGSEAEKAGFYYEMVSSDAETVATIPGFDLEAMPAKEDNIEVKLATKAMAARQISVFKNVYALLFTNTGAFNGRANIGVFMVGTAKDITFTDVVNPKGTWYVPTDAQLQMIWALYGGLTEGAFNDYNKFHSDSYWTSTSLYKTISAQFTQF